MKKCPELLYLLAYNLDATFFFKATLKAGAPYAPLRPFYGFSTRPRTVGKILEWLYPPSRDAAIAVHEDDEPLTWYHRLGPLYVSFNTFCECYLVYYWLLCIVHKSYVFNLRLIGYVSVKDCYCLFVDSVSAISVSQCQYRQHSLGGDTIASNFPHKRIYSGSHINL